MSLKENKGRTSNSYSDENQENTSFNSKNRAYNYDINAISKELRQKIDNISNSRDRLILEILWATGLNANELVLLKLSDIDFSKHILKVRAENTKNKNERILSISEELLRLIETYSIQNSILKTDFLFKTRQSSALSVRRLEQILSVYSLNSGEELTPRTIRKICIERELLSSDSESEIKIKLSLGINSYSKKKFISKTEYNTFKNKINSETHSLILETFWETGITLSELINLRKSDVSFSQNILIVRPENTRTGYPRAVIISSLLSSKLFSFTSKKSLSDYIFSSQCSDKFSPLRIRQIFDSYSELSGVNVTPQILRNSIIVNSLANGMPTSEICSKLGLQALNTNFFMPLVRELQSSLKKGGGKET